MELYKLKHKPTGLYYQPVRGTYSWRKSNLSKKGKIYQDKRNVLNGNSETMTISISERQYNSNKKLFENLGIYSYGDTFHIKCQKTDFEVEYV